MVDTLIAVDMLHYTNFNPPVSLALVTDDDDLVPALLAASLQSISACCLLRQRDVGHGLNDDHLLMQNIHIVKVGA
jgi:hypothetical protein